MQLPSRLIESAVDQMASLPGIGRRTALRLVLHMLARDEERVRDFAESMVAMRQGVKPCSTCHNPTEDGVCNICANPHRDSATLCVVVAPGYTTSEPSGADTPPDPRNRRLHVLAPLPLL